MTESETKSDAIRRLAASGMTTADIARFLSIRYQHVYAVTKGIDQVRIVKHSTQEAKPYLSVEEILRAGFVHSASWSSKYDGKIELDRALPKGAGVYAFSIENVIQYVGVATMGFGKRMYFYANPGASQTTNTRVKQLIIESLSRGTQVDLYIACPSDFEWNRLSVSGPSGLEFGLIKRYTLPWNIRSAR